MSRVVPDRANDPRRRRRRRRPATGLGPTQRLAAGIITLALLVGAFAVALRAPSGVPGRSYGSAHVTLPDVGNLRPHNDVRIAGVRVGQVLHVRSAGGQAQIELQLNGSVGDLPRDTTATVRSSGLLGQRYLELVPGRSATPLVDGGQIRAARTPITYGVPEALDTFDRETRGALGKTIRAAGTGLLGRGDDLNAAIGRAPRAARAFQRVAEAIVTPEAHADALLPQLSRASEGLDAARGPLSASFLPGIDALRPLVDRRSAFQATLDRAPGALVAARPALSATARLLRRTRALSVAVSSTLPDAPRSLRAATALLREGAGPLRRVAPLLRDVDRTVPDVLRATDAARPVLEPLKQPLDLLVQPVRRLGDHGCDIVNFAQVWRSFLGFGTASGGSRIGPLGEIRAQALVTMPWASAGDALRLPDALSQRDPYPKACKYVRSVYDLDLTR